MTTTSPLLRVRDLTKHFPVKGGALFARETGHVRAVDGVSFDLHAGEALGVVGESGCGKSTTGRLTLRLIEPTSGTVEFGGHNVLALGKAELRQMRRSMQIVFQDPQASLDPRMTVEEIVTEPLVVQGDLRGEARTKKARELLDLVGLPVAHISRYPHEFSGGQRQRIGIARALAPGPKLIVCDEPVSALDVSVQAQIVNLLSDLQKELGLAYLFIAHDLAVVRHLCQRVAVMYLGRIVEIGTVSDLFAKPQHPYTRMLLASVPAAHPRLRRTQAIPRGDVPSALNPPTGCHFHPRCAFATDKCRVEAPRPRETSPGYVVACHYAGELGETK